MCGRRRFADAAPYGVLPCTAFIVCAGAPEPLEIATSVLAVTACARAMLSIVEKYKTPISHRAVTMRVGCHAGTVLGAVVGRSLVRGPLARVARVCAHASCSCCVSQPRYQLFGQDMDVVQAMEQGSAPNAIHVSAAFATALVDAGLPGGLLLKPSEEQDGTFFMTVVAGGQTGVV